MKFRRVANRALRPVGISFAEWRVLEATWRIIRRTDEPASHLDVSRELELDEGCVSRLMHALSWRSFVSHDVDALGLGYRVRLTVSGKEAVIQAYAVVARVAARELGDYDGAPLPRCQSGRSSFRPEASQASTPPSR